MKLFLLIAITSLTVKAVEMDRSNTLKLDFGRAILLGASFEHALSPHWNLGIGYSSVSFASDSKYKITMVPIYVNYYPKNFSNRIFGTFGLNYISADLRALSNSFLPIANTYMFGTIGGGYEWKYDWGLTLHVALYVFLSPHFVFPWVGFGVGYSF